MDWSRLNFPDKTKPISKPPKPQSQKVQKFKFQASVSLDICKCPVCQQIYNSTIRAPLIICDDLHKICLFCFNSNNQLKNFFPTRQYPNCYKCNKSIFKLKLNKDILQIIKSNEKLQFKDDIDTLEQNIDDYIKRDALYKFKQGYMLNVSSSHSFEYIIDQKNQAKWRSTSKKQQKKDLFVSQIKTVVGKYPLPFGIFTIIARFEKFKLLNKNAQIGICTNRVFNLVQVQKKILCLNTAASISFYSQLSQVLDVSKAKTDFIKIKIMVNMFKGEISWMTMDDKNQILGYQEQNLKFGTKFLQQYFENLYFFMRYQNNQSANQLLQQIDLKTKKIQTSKILK